MHVKVHRPQPIEGHLVYQCWRQRAQNDISTAGKSGACGLLFAINPESTDPKDIEDSRQRECRRPNIINPDLTLRGSIHRGLFPGRSCLDRLRQRGRRWRLDALTATAHVPAKTIPIAHLSRPCDLRAALLQPSPYASATQPFVDESATSNLQHTCFKTDHTRPKQRRRNLSNPQ
jgi:hypothetical protein